MKRKWRKGESKGGKRRGKEIKKKEKEK